MGLPPDHRGFKFGIAACGAQALSANVLEGVYLEAQPAPLMKDSNFSSSASSLFVQLGLSTNRIAHAPVEQFDISGLK